MKFLKLLMGIALLPLCAAMTTTVIALIQSLGDAQMGSSPLGAWWLLGGFLFWLVLFFILPRPTRTYVLGHELTHAFWGLLMGARVSRLRVNAKGGSVTLSKSNVLITLAPYFFPFYTMLVLALHAILALFYNLSHYEPLWLALVGLTWSFHLTFTLQALATHQPDIAEHGRIFSYVVIYVLNLLGIGLWIVAVAHPTLPEWAGLLHAESAAVYAFFGSLIQRLWTQRGVP